MKYKDLKDKHEIINKIMNIMEYSSKKNITCLDSSNKNFVECFEQMNKKNMR